MAVYLCADSVRMLTPMLDLDHEVAGTFQRRGSQLVAAPSNNGSKDKIHVPRSTYTWHTHPNRCYNHDNCFFGPPSADDMRSILLDFHKGNTFHFVISHDGIYAVTVLTTDTACADYVHRQFRTLQQWFRTQRASYAEFKKRWLKLARKLGYGVQLVPLSPTSQIDLNVLQNRNAPGVGSGSCGPTKQSLLSKLFW